MPDHIKGRDLILDKLREELVGPKPTGHPLDTSGPVRFRNWREADGPWHDANTGEEILTAAGPSTRYGIGVLYPQTDRSHGAQAAEPELPEDSQMPDEALGELIQSLSQPVRGAGKPEDEDDDFDLASANAYRPSSMGITCRVRLPEGSRVAVVGEFGRYLDVPVVIGESERTWYRRIPVCASAAFPAAALRQWPVRKLVPEDRDARQRTGDDLLDVEVCAYSRPTDKPDERLVTFSIANKSAGGKDTAGLYQSHFAVEAQDGAAILPYREPAHELSDDPERATLDLLYRNHETFGIGHGCAADWNSSALGQVSHVEAVPLPVYEAPSITPVITLPGSSDPLEIDMRVLANDRSSDRADRDIQRLIDGYEAWIVARRTEIAALPEHMHSIAEQHLRDCEVARTRMTAGWSLVRNDPVVHKAFTLANQAMLTQQARSSAPLRPVTISGDDRFVFSGTPPTSEPDSGRGKWRPFQIAFFLAVLDSVADSGSQYRDTAELIFFPTGGGKTEAYLAVAAFSMFLRRLRDPRDAGTNVLMRYTLRLLSTQQFLRASSLVCAMEEIRERTPELGQAEFSIGIWVGSSSTPNTRGDADQAFHHLSSGGDNPFLLLRCPWCNAAFGPVGDRRTRRRGGRKKKLPVAGYVLDKGRFRFRCSDNRCHFYRRTLPVYVVDEDIYNEHPTLVIGTVDKFAMLAWRPKARALFGISADGTRACSPPGLIIQDELHLISGPLGSMAGLYEAVIEDLCTDDRGGQRVRPKIVASTATIRRYGEQIRNLYGRSDARLFPPHGLCADDSFFAVWARETDGSLQPGRRYVGVHGPGLGSMQTAQVRTASALLQAPMELPADSRDPWWTCLTFFNSLRELGNTLTLLQADIPAYLGGVHLRDGIGRDRQRWPRRTLELTSRLVDDQVPKAIDSLQLGSGNRECVDICLASSIVEVGVDIDRLSLMTVVGQPKTTSQYIQVTGRVGRRWQERPGLVVTLYGAAKPRDRSHFERFRSYHERLYAQVEPTSVTPFSLPVLERAVHAAIVTYVRQRGPERQDALPFPDTLASAAADILRARAATIGGVDTGDLERVIARRMHQWATRERDKWDANPDFGDPERGLMRFPGTSVPSADRRLTWETPSSMRNVDANCKIEITHLYAAAASAEGDGEA